MALSFVSGDIFINGTCISGGQINLEAKANPHAPSIAGNTMQFY